MTKDEFMHQKPTITIIGAGFIGQSLISAALNCGYSVCVLDRHRCPDQLCGLLQWNQGDMNSAVDLENTLQENAIVYHFVSTSVPGDEIDESIELQQNLIQSVQLLRLSVKKKVRRIIFASSASVYGIQEQLPVGETAITDPISSHGINKLAIEKYLLLYKHKYGLDCKIARISNPYGPGQNIYGRQGLIAMAIGHILSGKPVPVRGDGSIIRDYIYISDVAKALLILAEINCKELIFNVGSGIGYSVNEIIAILHHLSALPFETVYTDGRFVDIKKSILNVALQKDVIHMTPKISIYEGIARTVKYYGVPLSQYGKNFLDMHINES